MKLLYKTPLTEPAQTGASESMGSNLAEAGVLDAGAVVEQISTQSSDVSQQGRYQLGKWHSKMFAKELSELSESQLESLPLDRTDGDHPEAGYYEISNADVSPDHPQSESVWEWSADISKKGTKKDFYRQLEFNTREAEHEYGNDTTTILGLSSKASAVQWYDGESREPATPAETRQSEFTDVDIYHASDGEDALGADRDTLSLLYTIPYTAEREADCAVYDTLGAEEFIDGKYIENDGNRVRVWGSVFGTGHDPRGTIVLDNGLIRLYLDESNGSLEAETWDSAAEEWTSTDLSSPDSVSVYDVDLVEVGMVRDKVQITFDVDGSLFVLDAILQTGAESVLFDNPDPTGQGPIPVDLEDFLEPIASERYVDPQSAKTLVRRQNVRVTSQ